MATRCRRSPRLCHLRRTLSSVVVPDVKSRMSTWARPRVVPPLTKLLPRETNTTNRPSSLIFGESLSAFASVTPSGATETSWVYCSRGPGGRRA